VKPYLFTDFVTMPSVSILTTLINKILLKIVYDLSTSNVPGYNNTILSFSANVVSIYLFLILDFKWNTKEI